MLTGKRAKGRVRDLLPLPKLAIFLVKRNFQTQKANQISPRLGKAPTKHP